MFILSKPVVSAQLHIKITIKISVGIHLLYNKIPVLAT